MRRALLPALLLVVTTAGGSAAEDGGALPSPPGPIAIALERRAGRAGRSVFAAPQQKPEAVKVAQTGPIYAPLALYGEALLVAERSVHLFADGEPSARWTRRLDDLLFTAPFLADGMVFVGGDDDVLRSYSLPSGSPGATFRCGRCTPRTGIGPTASRCDIEGLARGDDGTIYVAADGVYALGPNFGLRWHYGPAQPTQAGNPVRPIHCLTVPVLAKDGTILVGCDDDRLHALGPDGQPRWTFAAGADVGAGTVVQSDGTIVFGTDEGKLYWLNPDGTVLRTLQLKSAVRSAPAQASNGTLYFSTVDGTLAAIGPDATLRWAFRSGARGLSLPLVDGNGQILVGAADSRVYALSSDGQVRWSVLLDAPIASTASPLIGADGAVWIGTVSGSVFALR